MTIDDNWSLPERNNVTGIWIQSIVVFLYLFIIAWYYHSGVDKYSCLFSTGRIQTNMELFPRGIKFLSDYLHEKGLKIGMYSSAGR